MTENYSVMYLKRMIQYYEKLLENAKKELKRLEEKK